MMEGILAALTSLLAVACIYWSWRDRGQAVVSATGWLLALGSAVVWSHVLGPEFGVTFAIIVFMCLTWLAVLADVAARKGSDTRAADTRAAPRPYQALVWPRAGQLLQQGVLFLLSVPAAGVLTLMLSVALVLYLPWTLLNKLAVAIFLWPVLWGVLSAWIAAQQKVSRPALVVASLFVVSSLALFV